MSCQAVEIKTSLREQFARAYPDVKAIKQVDINRLVFLLDDEFEDHWLSGDGLHMFAQPLDRFTAASIRKNGIGERGLTIKCGAHYFTDRDAITITGDGRVYFCSWASTTNEQPILKAFQRWLVTKRG